MNSFPKIHALGNRFTADIFQSEVEITEKLDGSQIGWSVKLDGELVIRSKGAIINQDAPESLFKEAVDYIKSIKHLLPIGTFYYGECFKRPKHNTLAYNRIPKNHIALFAYGLLPDKYCYDYDVLCEVAERLGLETAPLVAKGKISGLDFEKLIDQESVLGGCKMEGVVIKNYSLPCMITQDVILPITCAKFVSEGFKEVHQNRWKKEETKGGKLESLFDRYRTQARWNKAIQHLKEKGLLDDSPKDIGPLLKEINEDIEQEEKENIKEELYAMFRKQLLQNATKGFPEYYKRLLMEGVNYATE